MPCTRKPQFRRGRLPRCLRALCCLRGRGEVATAELWNTLSSVEPSLEISVARNTLRHLERRGYVEGRTLHLVGVPGGRQRRWKLTTLGTRVFERLMRLCAWREAA